MKNVVAIISTPRKGGNSELLTESFVKGARETGHNVEVIYLRDYNFNYCRACYACLKTGECVQKDGYNEVVKKLLNADVILFSTPTYFYSMSGQLKVFIDRLVPHYEKIHADIYLFATAWDDNVKQIEMVLDAIRGCTRDCFSNCTEKGHIIVGGVNETSDIKGHKAINEAYIMGKKA